MKPTVGRIVHYYDDKGILHPAIITAVTSDTVVDLRVFGASYLTEASVSQWTTGDKVSCWEWPART